jgi:hypothetical protein
VVAPGNADRPGNDRSSGDDSRRKRSNARYVGWGDGLSREYCDRMSHLLPRAFPVAAHGGAATIRAAVVARRPGALLLCTYDHCGAHVWPDGDIVSDDEATSSEAPAQHRD